MPRRRRRLFQDIETFCALDLTKVGVSRYARHPTNEILMLSYTVDHGPIKQFDALSALGPRSEFASLASYRQAWLGEAPAEWIDNMADPDVDKSGWNAGQFERVEYREVLGMDIPPDEWRDTMVLAFTLSFPGKLDRALRAAGFDEEDQKLASGKALMRYFSQPRRPTKTMPRTRNMPADAPQKWADYLAYNRQDVHTERLFYYTYADFDLPDHEWEMWEIDQRINDAGIPINLDMVDNALTLIDRITEDRMVVMRELTGLKNPNSGDQLLPWLRDRGYPFVDLKKGHVARAIDDRLVGDTEALDVLKLRREVNKASVKKYAALWGATDNDGLLRYGLQFAAAGRTWRWGGRKFQAQNLARPHKLYEKRMPEVADDIQWMFWKDFDRKYVDPKTRQPLSMEALSTGVRPTVQAPDGMLFIDADLNAIENRMLGWLADDRAILKVFELDLDPYIDFGVDLFGESYADLWKEYKAGNTDKRQKSKPGPLGCGYGLGEGQEYEDQATGEIEATGLLGYAWNMGIKNFTLEDSRRSVQIWRRKCQRSVEYWGEFHGAMFECVATGRPRWCFPCEFRMKGEFLQMILPSDRPLNYHRPKIMPMKTPWGEIRDTITYMGLNERGGWYRKGTHPGKTVENEDQAIARDVIAAGIKRAVREGIDVRLHVHDQIIGLAPERDAERQLKILVECMSEKNSWAKGLPLKASGHVSKVFVKG